MLPYVVAAALLLPLLRRPKSAKGETPAPPPREVSEPFLASQSPSSAYPLDPFEPPVLTFPPVDPLPEPPVLKFNGLPPERSKPEPPVLTFPPVDPLPEPKPAPEPAREPAPEPAPEPARELSGPEAEIASEVEALVKARFGGDYRQGFDAYANKDGKMGTKELERIFKDARLGNAATRKVYAQATLAKLDEDKDGRVSWEEFERVFS